MALAGGVELSKTIMEINDLRRFVASAFASAALCPQKF
jgi:hypothetical protein